MAHIEKRTSPITGKTSYKAQVALKGYPRQTATFARITDAKRWVTSIESAMREGRYFKTSEARKHTLADLIDRYSEVTPPKILKDRAHCLKWWVENYGHLVLADVTPKVVAEAKRTLSQRVSPTTGKVLSPSSVSKHLITISKILNYGVRELEWIDSNPCSKVEPPKLPGGRTRYLSDEERAALLLECRKSVCPYLYPMVILGLATGMRLGEIQGLHWKTPRVKPDKAWGVVDLARGRITLHATKNGDSRPVPLGGHALALLVELKAAQPTRVDTDRCFPATRRGGSAFDFRKHWQKALADAGIEDFRFHDLRHSCASYLAMNGATLAEIGAVLGHRTLAMVKRYSHISEPHTGGVLGRLNDRLFGGN